MTRYGMIKMMGKLEWTTNEIENFDSFKAAMQSIVKNSNRVKVSLQTRRHYLSALRQYLQFVNSEEGLTKEINPNDLIKEAHSDIEGTKDKIRLFFLWLQGEPVEGFKPREKSMRKTSACVRAYAQMRGFYTNNGIAFGKWKTPSLADMKKEAIENDVSTPFFKLDRKRKIFLDRGMVKQFLTNLKLRDATIFLAALSSSHDSGDILSLNVGDIRKQKDRERFFWDEQRGKTGVRFKTFFSVEATDYIRRYLKQERQGAEDNEPLFVYGTRLKGQIKATEKRMKPQHLSSVYRDSARKMGMPVGNGYQNPFRPKRLRHIFRTACTHAHIDEGYINAFMGHRTSVSKDYLEKDLAFLEFEYSKAEPFLTVYGVGGTEGLEKLETDLAEWKGMYADLKVKVDGLEIAVENLTENFNKNVKVEANDLFQRWLKELYGEEQEAIKEEQEWKEGKEKEVYPSPQKAEKEKISEKVSKIDETTKEEKTKPKLTYREEILGTKD